MPRQIGSWFAESRPRNAKENETENESCLTSQEDQFKGNFLLPLIDHAICCLINGLSKCIRWVRFLIFFIIKKVYPNLRKALRVLLTCPEVSVAGTAKSFSTLKPIKIFHRSTMMDERHYVISNDLKERVCEI